MEKLREMIDGRKSYIMVGVIIATAAAQAFGVVIPEWVYMVETALLGGAVRIAISKV